MKNQPLIQGRDYYVENGFYVFTAYYLQNRGYCCDNACRHCPYKEETNKDNLEAENKKS
jgi:hypothetical protein